MGIQTTEERLHDVLVAIESLASGYEKLRAIPTGPEIAADIRVLLEVAQEVPEDRTAERAQRRAEYVVAHVDCPRCGRPAGQPCIAFRNALADHDTDRVFPHREREIADAERREAQA